MCAICLDPLADDAATMTMDCGHRFHGRCLLRWAQSSSDGHDRCPVCRFSASEQGDEMSAEFTSVSYDTFSNDRVFTRLASALDRCAADFNDSETALYEMLAREAEAAARRARGAKEKLRDFRRAHKQLLQRFARLQSASWQTRGKAISARRMLLGMFPVTCVVVRRRGAPRGIVRVTRQLRRSQRIAERAGAAQHAQQE